MSDKYMVHIECRSQEVLCRVPYDVAVKFCEVDEEFKEKFKIANRRHLNERTDNTDSGV